MDNDSLDYMTRNVGTPWGDAARADDAANKRLAAIADNHARNRAAETARERARAAEQARRKADEKAAQDSERKQAQNSAKASVARSKEKTSGTASGSRLAVLFAIAAFVGVVALFYEPAEGNGMATLVGAGVAAVAAAKLYKVVIVVGIVALVLYILGSLPQ